jgi:hypothetical protein
VTRHVGECFLANPKHHRRAFRLHTHLLLGQGADAGHAGPALKILCLPFDGRYQPEVVQHGRPQFGHDPLERRDRGVDKCLHGADLFVRLVMSPGFIQFHLHA